VSTTRVNRYTTTDTSYSLSPTVQSTNTDRPGFSSGNRKLWTLNANGTNSVTLTQTYSPSSNLFPVSGGSIIGLGENSSDPALKSHLGIPSTRCKAVYTGASTVTISASTLNNRYDVETSYFTETLDGVYVSNTRWNQTLNGSTTVINNSNRGLPTSHTFSSRTLTNSGSDITMISADQQQILGGNNKSTVNISVAFDGSTSESFTHTHTSTGTLIRTWEGDNHVIDGEGGDNDPNLQVAFTFPDVLPAMQRFGEASSTATFTTTEASINKKFATADLTTTSSLSVTPKYIADTTKTLAVTTEVLSSTDNLVKLVAQTLPSAFAFTVTDTLKTDAETTESSSANVSSTGNLIFDIAGDYTWDNVAGIAGASDYEWDARDSWALWDDDEWGDNPEQWDNWDLNLWARPYNIILSASTTETVSFKRAGLASLNVTTTLSEDAALNQPAAANLSDGFTTSFTARGIIDAEASLTGAFSPTLTDTVIFDQPSTLTITGAFTPVLTANATLSGETALSVSSAFSITPTHKRGPFQLVLTSAFTQPDTIPSRKLGPFQLVLPALASKLIEGRLFFSTDAYNVITVPAETNTITLPAETRITAIDQENRVNKVVAETRTHMVSQETRRHKLRIPPVSDRFTIPKQRAEA
jgi:hypothetical protein